MRYVKIRMTLDVSVDDNKIYKIWECFEGKKNIKITDVQRSYYSQTYFSDHLYQEKNPHQWCNG